MKTAAAWLFAVGILFSVSGSEVAAGARVRSSPFGFHPAAIYDVSYTSEAYADARTIGVKWARDSQPVYWFLVQPDLARQEFDFTLIDSQLGKAPAGLNVLGNIAPQGLIDMGYCAPGSYLPIDTEKYVAFVKATVERYDGDGVGDMVDLVSPVRHWQVGNEPSIWNAADFDQLQKITYTAIKEVCPECTVLIGGVYGQPPADSYIREFEQRYRPILDALGGKYVDVADFHWYGNATGDYRGAKEVATALRSALTEAGFAKIPIWVTEMGTYSGCPTAEPGQTQTLLWQSEAQQAEDLFKRFIYSLASGVDKVFPAFGLMEGFKNTDGYFDHTGLVYEGHGSDDLGLGVKKLSYYTYRKMTDTLEEADWGSLQVVQDSGNVVVCRIRKGRKPIYIAWWDYANDDAYTPGARKLVTIRGLKGTPAWVFEVVPAASCGVQIDHYAAAFLWKAVTTKGGRLSVPIGTSPVVIEPQ